MKPIIKWSGGKSQEIKFFEHKFPKKYNRYVEPFIGGGGVFFNLENSNSIINDINFELISFYNLLKNEKDRNNFILQLELLNKQRNIFNNYFNNFSNNEIQELFNSKIDKTNKIDLELNHKYILEIILHNHDELKNEIQLSIKDKIKRIKDIEIKNNKIFNIDELKNHLTTGLQSALYFNSRNIYNLGFKNSSKE